MLKQIITNIIHHILFHFLLLQVRRLLRHWHWCLVSWLTRRATLNRRHKSILICRRTLTRTRTRHSYHHQLLLCRHHFLRMTGTGIRHKFHHSVLLICRALLVLLYRVTWRLRPRDVHYFLIALCLLHSIRLVYDYRPAWCRRILQNKLKLTGCHKLHLF